MAVSASADEPELSIESIPTPDPASAQITPVSQLSGGSIASPPNPTANPALAQATSVSQLSDVQPTDWAFQALQSLVERYGCIAGYPMARFAVSGQ
ncbi:MAG: hypothetical protein HC895_24360 [Leptolyngbyaceae cyanobacterium SM1_3_5]|nr:hypothetical protein [Leptolyngbyaceae cyanobacterium SM1_3_5]